MKSQNRKKKIELKKIKVSKLTLPSSIQGGGNPLDTYALNKCGGTASVSECTVQVK
ncbi:MULTISPECIES: hypothetical protein [Aquimarina]|uniref:hypothetical protein n=1 Tax=Aquimarina TaxID=290174 RepID=UPI000AF59F3D|nr:MULTISPECIES: hypothetical protein [Aquimarina]